MPDATAVTVMVVPLIDAVNDVVAVETEVPGTIWLFVAPANGYHVVLVKR